MRISRLFFLLGVCTLALASCKDDNTPQSSTTGESAFIGKAVGNFEASEWYPGGELGTTDNILASCYEDETPAVTRQGLTQAFNHGEFFFERNVTLATAPFKGLGPASVRKSCLDCHPGYGHGKRQTVYEANTAKASGNGYLLVVYKASGEPNNPYGTDATNDGPYVAEVTGMPQTMAAEPFLPPIDESQIQIIWHKVPSMPSGLPMAFNDGEEYSLIYPEVLIPESAYNTDPTPHASAAAAGTVIGYRLESTIGVIGSGIIDAIDQDDIREQYRAEAPYVELNPAFWDKAANDFAASAYYHNWQKGEYGAGYDADGNFYERDTYRDGKLLKKFTYAMTRGTLQDGAGANAIWNITNVSRPDRPFLYTTAAWATAMSKNEDVIAAIKAAGEKSPYYCDVDGDGNVTDAEISEAVLALLSPSTNQFDNDYHNFEPEMSADEFYDFMVWHRGLAIPRARNLQDPDVQRGKKLFIEMGCATCHRPKWETRDDNYWAPAMNGTKPLPRYANQTIYPYSDFIQHRLYMANDIHGTWCRTTPLWGRGLSQVNTGASDRLHDCRARNVVEAIMWHGFSKESDAYQQTEKFYNLPKEDRDAVVKFIESI
ncbi:MAG: c-type cytochrome [Bacteroidales bacterium]|nr:c-type cytochrome [Bacteroidales bacterium]